MALRSILNAKQWTIVKSAPDGLCLLHSVKSSLKYQLRRNIELEELKCVVFSESVNNMDKYLPSVGNKLSYVKQLNSYLIHRQYSHAMGDIVPNILASGLNLRINILDVRENLVRETLIKPFDESAIHEISIKLQNEHYDGIAPSKDVFIPPAPPAHVTNDVAFCDVPSELFDVATSSVDAAPSCFDVAPSCCDVEAQRKDDAHTLLDLRDTGTVTRAMRRRVFYLGINRIIHSPSPACITVPTSQWNVPRLMLSNPTSITNKIDELRTVVRQESSDIVAICESWLHPDMSSDVFGLPGFHPPIRHDRAGRRGGGVMCYLRNSMSYKLWSEFISRDVESLWITIYPVWLPRAFGVLTLGIIYHPPGANNYVLTSHIQTCIDKIHQKYPTTGLIIMGDLNQYPCSKIQTNYNLRQLVKSPTFMSKTLDKILTNMGDLYASPVILPPLGSLDRGHNTVTCVAVVPQTKSTAGTYTVRKRDQSIANKASLGQAVIDFPWHKMYNMVDYKEKFRYFQSSMENLMDQHIPFKTVARANGDPPWVTDRFRDVVQERREAWLNKLPSYRYLKKKVRRMSRQLKKDFYKKSLSEMSNHKQSNWWEITKKLLGKNQDNSAIFKTLADTSSHGDLDKLCDNINNFFVSISDDLTPLGPRNTSESVVPDNLIISEQDVEECLMGLDIKKAPGPDGIPTWLLRDMTCILSKPICHLFNISLSHSYLPAIWKSANITCIPKVSPPTDITSDLRPISLLPIISKQLEKLIGRHIWHYVSPHIKADQFGGVTNSSTILAMVDMLNKWHMSVKERNLVRVVMLDYRKAFDHVCHQVILQKLQMYNVPGVLIDWVHSFLLHRQQRTRIGDHFSEWKEVRGGVPQGSWLGPVLFIVAINDLQLAKCVVHKYMDDTTISESVSPDVVSSMPHILEEVLRWSTRNKMNLNPRKTKEMVISFRRSIVPPQELTLEGAQISRVQHCKLLGITLQNDLKWGLHVSDLESRAARRVYFLKCLKRAGAETDKLIQYYTACIRSLLEYGSILFHPGLTQQQKMELENIQKRALRIIIPNKDYAICLSESKLETLNERREKHCRALFKEIQGKNHRLHHLLPPLNPVKYNLRKQRTFSTSTNHHSNRLNSEFITYCINNFNY